MNNIKQFANNALYESYINSSEAIYPNVSVVNKGEHVYYNPEEIIPPTVVTDDDTTVY